MAEELHQRKLLKPAAGGAEAAAKEGKVAKGGGKGAEAKKGKKAAAGGKGAPAEYKTEKILAAEEIEEKANEILGSGAVTQLASSNRKERLAGMESLLLLHPAEWQNDESFQQLQLFINNLRVTNVCAEHAVQLASTFAGKITRNEEQKQYLYATVKKQRRERNDLSRKVSKNAH